MIKIKIKDEYSEKKVLRLIEMIKLKRVDPVESNVQNWLEFEREE